MIFRDDCNKRYILVYLCESYFPGVEVDSYNVVSAFGVSYVERNDLVVSCVVLVSEHDVVQVSFKIYYICWQDRTLADADYIKGWNHALYNP